MVSIIQQSPNVNVLRAIKIYDPTMKTAISTTGLSLTFVEPHNVTNSFSGQIDPAAIYKS